MAVPRRERRASAPFSSETFHPILSRPLRFETAIVMVRGDQPMSFLAPNAKPTVTPSTATPPCCAWSLKEHGVGLCRRLLSTGLVAHPKGCAYRSAFECCLAQDSVGRSFRACDQSVTGAIAAQRSERNRSVCSLGAEQLPMLRSRRVPTGLDERCFLLIVALSFGGFFDSLRSLRMTRHADPVVLWAGAASRRGRAQGDRVVR